MTILVVILLGTLIWFVLACVRDGRADASTVDVSHAWMVEQHERVVRLGREAAIPEGHPLARLDLGHEPRRA